MPVISRKSSGRFVAAAVVLVAAVALAPRLAVADPFNPPPMTLLWDVSNDGVSATMYDLNVVSSNVFFDTDTNLWVYELALDDQIVGPFDAGLPGGPGPAANRPGFEVDIRARRALNLDGPASPCGDPGPGPIVSYRGGSLRRRCRAGPEVLSCNSLITPIFA